MGSTENGANAEKSFPLKDENEEWSVPCSDEETSSYSTIMDNKLIWEPKPEEIVQLYMTLERKGILDLEWQCPGRRSPSVHSSESESVDRRAFDDDDGKKGFEPNEFDFDDESSESSTPRIAQRRRGTPGSSAQKRVARLDKVMFDIRRYRKLDKLEQQRKMQSAGGQSIHEKSSAVSGIGNIMPTKSPR